MSTPLLQIFTDGGSRGNPGPAGIGVVVLDQNGQTIYEFAGVIGVATNNVAEYSALLKASEYLESLESQSPQVQPERIEFYLDSELVVSQMIGRYKIKDENLKKIADKVKNTLSGLGIQYNFTHVRREKNTRADWLVNQALDAAK